MKEIDLDNLVDDFANGMVEMTLMEIRATALNQAVELVSRTIDTCGLPGTSDVAGRMEKLAKASISVAELYAEFLETGEHQ